jgi:hypothetical protein
MATVYENDNMVHPELGKQTAWRVNFLKEKLAEVYSGVRVGVGDNH